MPIGWVASSAPLTPKNRRRRISPNQGRNRPMSEASKRYYEQQKRLGLCVQCSRKAATGLISCWECLERTRKWRMERHPLYCLECRKLIGPEERTGRIYHKKCVQKRIARMYPLVHRRAALAYQERHRRLGLCYDCPRKAFKGGLCQRHYELVLKRNYDRAAGSVKLVS